MFLACLASLVTTGPSLVPMPNEVKWRDGSFPLGAAPVANIPESAFGLIDELEDALNTEFKSSGNASIRLVLEKGASKSREGYTLTVDKSGVTVRAADNAGLFYGIQTLGQLYSEDGTIPYCEIADEPRFSWRGMHLDVSRHFFSTEFIKQYIDLLAMHKMNVFHWHLVDDGGWRMEVKKYPRLTSVGAWRIDTGGKWPGGEWNYGNLQFCMDEKDGPRYGGFYSQDEIREIVAYAAEKFVTVVPEIEMPGHSLPAIVAYPEFGCDNVEPPSEPGRSVTNVFCAGKDTTLAFLENVLDETMGLFPSKFIHIGADEVWKGHWKNCPKCLERMEQEDLADADELQSWFVRHFDSYLASKGRRLVGWDEILEGGLAPGATVMSWRGISGGIEAAKAGRDVVMSPTSHCYFDYPYTSISTKMAYEYDPIPEELGTDEAQHILGAQGNVWTEWMPTEEFVERMAFPRACALAEAVWTQPENKNWDDFSGRLKLHLARLDNLGVGYNIDPPSSDFDTVVLDDVAQIEFKAPPMDGVVVRYTLDGTEPTEESSVYVQPLAVDRPCIVNAVAFAPSGNKSLATTVRVIQIKRESTSPDSLKSGLNVNVHAGAYSKLDGFVGKPTSINTTSPNLSLAEWKSMETFGIEFSGYMYIPVTGDYTFTLTSDDGSGLWLGGSLAIDNDGLHSSLAKRLRLRLQGGYYPFKVAMFEGGGAETLKLEVDGPGISGPVPDDWFFH